MDERVISVFAVYEITNGFFAATTRPDSPGVFGLPGGKAEPGEDPTDALLRECVEEGWMVLRYDQYPFLIKTVGGMEVYWYRTTLVRVQDYKEKDRLEPVVVPDTELAKHFFNDEAIELYRKGW